MTSYSEEVHSGSYLGGTTFAVLNAIYTAVDPGSGWFGKIFRFVR